MTFALVNILMIAVFSYFYLQQLNFEFLLYIGAILVFGMIILMSNRHFKYSGLVLSGLTIWALMHLAGGIVPFDGDVLYNWMIYPFSDEYKILKYDQVVHTFGFFTTTLLFSEVLRPHLRRKKAIKLSSLLILLFMAGLGAGAMNEILEFTATVLVPETNVGGYINTSLDLVFNSFGALCALVVISFRK